jgi:hypothetical protein
VIYPALQSLGLRTVVPPISISPLARRREAWGLGRGETTLARRWMPPWIAEHFHAASVHLLEVSAIAADQIGWINKTLGGRTV